MRTLVAFMFISLTTLFTYPGSGQAQEKDLPSGERFNIPLPAFGLINQEKEPNDLTKPCEPGTDERVSDLCAQWKAADAAKKAADWSVIIGLAATFIGFFTLIAAVAAAIFAKQASKAGVVAAKHAETDLKLSNPPRFKLTRPIVYKKDPLDEKNRTLLPDFLAGAEIHGRSFMINYGRYPATIYADSSGRLYADCYLYFAKGASIPMGEPYRWAKERDKWVAPDFFQNGEPAPAPAPPTIPSGGIIGFTTNVQVPDSFSISAKGKWSHTLYMIAAIRYVGDAEDARGAYFCKRYVPNEQRFEDASEYENED